MRKVEFNNKVRLKWLAAELNVHLSTASRLLAAYRVEKGLPPKSIVLVGDIAEYLGLKL